MLTITIPGIELFDESTMSFIMTKERTLKLEHSLVSISKWEAIWKKPYLKPKYKMTVEEFRSYVQCMTLTQNVNPEVYKRINGRLTNQIYDYMQDDMTATTVRPPKNSRGGIIVTSEVLYSWMAAHNIDFDCQKWHLNRLLTLINVCNANASPKQKMTQKEVYERNKVENARRREAMKSKG